MLDDAHNKAPLSQLECTSRQFVNYGLFKAGISFVVVIVVVAASQTVAPIEKLYMSDCDDCTITMGKLLGTVQQNVVEVFRQIEW